MTDTPIPPATENDQAKTIIEYTMRMAKLVDRIAILEAALRKIAGIGWDGNITQIARRALTKEKP